MKFRPPPTALAALIALAGLALLDGGGAEAHGGRIVLPPPPMPPQPPPPPFIPRSPVPPGTPAPTPPPPSSTPGAGPTTPNSGPPTGGPRTPESAGPDVGAKTPRLQRPGKAKYGGGEGGWRDWWDANADSLRGARGLGASATYDNTVFRVGGDESGNRSDRGRPTQKAVEREILPVLRAAIDPKSRQDPDAVAAALIALGKTARGPADIAAIEAALCREGAKDVDLEAAALALGLLRRSDPDLAFDGAALDEVRRRLFDTMDDPRMPGRVRCFSALATGLLGDQPTDPKDAFARDGRLVVRDLWIRLEAEQSADEVPVAILSALALQPRAGVPQAVLDGLRGLCISGRLGGRVRGPLTRAHAALTLARLGDGDSAGLFLGIAKSHNFDLSLRQCAIAGLSILAPRLDAERRAAAVAGLSDLSRAGDPESAGLALISISKILAAEFFEGSGSLAEKSEGDEALLKALGSGGTRAFAALALGIAGRAAGKASDAAGFAEFREKALTALRGAADDSGADPDSRGAFCLALGILEDERSLPALLGIASRRGNGPVLRADACAAIGLLARPSPEALATLREALGERSSDDLRREAARALGSLGDASATAALVRELRLGAPDHVLARVALALGAIGNTSSIEPLAALAADTSATDEVRAVAIASLGLIGDPEPVPSLSRLGTDCDYLARTDALHEAMSLL